MQIEPRISLVFNGDCDAAFTLYQQCLEGAVTFRLTWGDSPMADQAPAEWRDKILHATLKVGGFSQGAKAVATSIRVPSAGWFEARASSISGPPL